MGLIRTVAETGSTNADLATAIRAGERIVEGEWLVADSQTAGRGRQGKAWSDGRGNFMGSTAVRLDAAAPTPATLSFAAGLAVYEAVAPLLPDPAPLQLKWPNDLTYRGAKLAGILLEREGDWLVVGIGVNLAAAPVIAGRETVAVAQIAPPCDRDRFAARLAAVLAQECERWRSYGLEPLLRRWQAAAHPPGTALSVTPPGETGVQGAFAGLTSEGALRLRLADGSTRVMHAGEVFFAAVDPSDKD